MNAYMDMWDRVVAKYSGEYGPCFADYKAKTGLRETILLGRAGEGVWLAGELLAAAAIEQGKESKVIFSMPGERRNSPTRSFLRVADTPIHFPASWIHNADDVLILEEELATLSSAVLDLDIPTIIRRMNPDGFCIVNSAKGPGQLQGGIPGRTVTVDATRISVELFGSPFFVNLAVIGAYLAAAKVFSLEQLESAIANFTNPRGHKVLSGKQGERNVAALRAGYGAARIGRP
ncbi:MAG: 2-oxoacid:acceptor oxidoreductase family protein [Deltaproteobacteria bacterium]|nr:2-oxoacid:acceptor oxidoreductase family protein [Deltaproteobacteria bacterium]